MKTDKTGTRIRVPLVCRSGHDDIVQDALSALEESRIMERLWNRDHTLWKEDPEEILNRLGWLDIPGKMKDAVDRIQRLVDGVKVEGFTDVLLLGMGGSSLAPDLFRRTFVPGDGFLSLKVLDTTDPAAVRSFDKVIDPVKTLFIVSTKSGTTIETTSLFRHFFNRTVDTTGRDSTGKHFIAITDPESPLQKTASELGFREIFLNDPDIGGRYSALSYFGLVPAAFMGVDIDLILERAMAAQTQCFNAPATDGEGNPGAMLGGMLGAYYNGGMDKLTFILSPRISAFGAWLEQLLAESTGKEGKGILPVDGELPGKPEVYGKDRCFVYIKTAGDDNFDSIVSSLENEGKPVVRLTLADDHDLGSEFYLWETATAVAGHLMEINPFDQPNVESAKLQAKKMLDEYFAKGSLPTLDPDHSEEGIDVFSDMDAENLMDYFNDFLSDCRHGDYVAIQAFLNPVPETALALGELRHVLRERYRVATTVGFGPRFLHSTGQLHKGGSGSGLFIQITADDAEDLPIPDEPGETRSSVTFGVLKAAQAMGDRQALIDAGRRIIRFHMKRDIVEGIRVLKEKIG